MNPEDFIKQCQNGFKDLLPEVAPESPEVHKMTEKEMRENSGRYVASVVPAYGQNPRKFLEEYGHGGSVLVGALAAKYLYEHGGKEAAEFYIKHVGADVIDVTKL